MTNNKKRKLILLSFVFFAISTAFSQQEISFLNPEKTTDIETFETEIIFRANKQKAKVFINDNFVGLTPLTVKKLIPGNYTLSVENEDLKKTFLIEVKRYIRQEYFIDFSEK